MRTAGLEMTTYQNGKIPDTALITLDSGPKHRTSPKAAAMWYALRANVERDHEATLHITPGWNAYRPYAAQEAGRKDACAAGNCDAAARPGWSSHGGTWIDDQVTGGAWVDALAFDIGDYWRIGQDAFYQQARRVGFIVGAITKDRARIDEPWHIIVLDPWGPVPASLDAHPATEEDPVPENKVVDYRPQTLKRGEDAYLEIDTAGHIAALAGPATVSGSFYVNASGSPIRVDALAQKVNSKGVPDPKPRFIASGTIDPDKPNSIPLAGVLVDGEYLRFRVRKPKTEVQIAHASARLLYWLG